MTKAIARVAHHSGGEALPGPSGLILSVWHDMHRLRGSEQAPSLLGLIDARAARESLSLGL
jgi:hypothetical protein